MHQGNRFQKKMYRFSFCSESEKRRVCLCVCVILFHLLHFEGKKKRAKQMTEKKLLSRVLLGESSF